MVNRRLNPMFAGVSAAKSNATRAVVESKSRRVSRYNTASDAVLKQSAVKRIDHSLLPLIQPTKPMSQPIMGGLL